MCPPTVPSECEECVAECNVKDCNLSTEEQCTDHCVVVPCNDPCIDSCGVCPTPSNCSQIKNGQCHGFEDLVSLLPGNSSITSTDFPQLKCCSDQSYSETPHSNFTSQASITQDNQRGSFPDWSNTSLSRELDELLCACNTQTLPHEFNSKSCDPNLLLVNKPRHNAQQEPRSVVASASAQMSSRRSSVSDLISPKLTPSLSSCSSPVSSPVVEASPKLTPPSITSNLLHHPHLLRCRWATCERAFETPEDLAAHVNIVHLHLPLPREGVHAPGHAVHQQPSSSEAEYPSHQDPNWLSCLWDNCSQFPTPSQVPGPSVGNVFEAAKGFLACHVQQDHLGLPVSNPSTYDESREPVRDEQHPFPDKFSAPVSGLSAHCRSFPSSRNDPRNDQSCANIGPIPSQYLCRWESCTHAGVPFGSVVDLTSHITDVHVGAGSSRYNCLWVNCNRNGDSGFTSKQKILRHIQVSHCKIPHCCYFLTLLLM